MKPADPAAPRTTASPPWYRPIRALANAITILLGVQIAVLVTRALAYMARIGLLRRLTNGEFVTRAQVQDADMRVVGVAGLWLLVFIATGVLWLVWQHRAQANAQHLTTKKLTFSPGWAVGWWFIPLASLVQPFRAVRELWQASGGDGTRGGGTWPVPVLWWSAWLGFDLFSLLGRRPIANNVAAFTAADEFGVIAMLLGIASAALAIPIVRAVVRRQRSGIQAWAEVAASEAGMDDSSLTIPLAAPSIPQPIADSDLPPGRMRDRPAPIWPGWAAGSVPESSRSS